MDIIKSKVDQAGRILIPAAHRQLLHLMPGEEVILEIDDGELRIRSFKESAKHARNLVKKYNSDNKDLVELLFQTRKEDKTHE